MIIGGILVAAAGCGARVTSGDHGGGDLAGLPSGDGAGLMPADASGPAAPDLPTARPVDFSVAPRDLTPPPPTVTVLCNGGTTTCRGVAYECCLGAFGGGGCIAPGGQCIGSVYACDGSDDCADGQECCEEVSGGSCKAIGSCGTRLCETRSDCRLGQKCCPTTSSHKYSYCADLCQ